MAALQCAAPCATDAVPGAPDTSDDAVPPDFHKLLAFASSVFCVLNPNGTLLYVSASAERVMHADPAAMVGCALRVASSRRARKP